MSNNVDTPILTTSSYPAGVWLFTYQATVYFATAPGDFLSFRSYLTGPSGGVLSPITQFGKMINASPQSYVGSNVVASQSSSACVIFTTSTAITLYVGVNTNAAAKGGGTDTSNVQATYISATRIG